MLRVSSSCLRSLGFSSSPLLSGVAAAAARSKFAFPVPLVLRRGYADDSFKSLLDEISASITKPTSSSASSSSSIKDSSNENKPSSQQWNRPRNGSASTERQQRYDDDYQSNDVEENERPRDKYRSEGGGYGDGGRRGSRGRGGYEDSRGSRYDGDSQGGYNGNSRGGRRGYEREEGYNETRGGYGRSRDYGDSRGSRGDYGGSRGGYGGRGDYGGREGRGGEGGRRGPMEFNNSKLEEVDWKQVELTPLNKNYYEEHEAVKGTTELDLHKWRLQHSITVKGSGCPNPVLSFEHTSFPPEIIQCLTSHYEAPTPIQAQGWPVALSGRDMVGSSQTGSGKTLGFILPALVHIKAQLQVQPHRWSDGPIAVVLVPTRELALQVLDESHEYIRKLNLKAVAAYGGSPRGAQANALRQGVHLVVATPGRLIDFLQEGTTNLRRATYVVLDEADRMLDMGFEPQIRQIMTQMRPDRQTLMWSATWPMKVQALAYEFFNDPLTIHVGSTELRANPNVTQKVHVVPEREKHQRATDLIKEIHKTGPVKTLVFCATQEGADRLCWALQTDGFRNTAAIHGGKAQGLRMQMLSSFRDGKLSILVATDVAARGLDINNIQHVINYDFPNEIEDYIHRIGRTGRAGRTGTAHTFLSHENNPGKQVSHLIKVLRDAGQEVTDELRALGVSSFGGGGGYGRPRQRRFIGRR